MAAAAAFGIAKLIDLRNGSGFPERPISGNGGDEPTAPRRGSRVRQAAVYPFLFPFVTIALRVDGWRFALLELRGGRRWLELALLSLNVALWAAAIVLLGWQWLGIIIGSQLVGGFYQGLVVAPNHKGMPLWAKDVEL